MKSVVKQEIMRRVAGLFALADHIKARFQKAPASPAYVGFPKTSNRRL